MKKIVLALIAACMTLSLCGCTKISDIVNIARAVSEGGNGGGEDIYGNNDPIYDGLDDGFTMEDFEDFMLYGDGTFDIPYGWEVSSRNSTSDKVFFIKEGDEEVDVPDNISVKFIFLEKIHINIFCFKRRKQADKIFYFRLIYSDVNIFFHCRKIKII